MSATAPVLESSKSLLQRLKQISDPSRREEFLATHKTELGLQLVIDIANEARELLRVDARKSLALSELAIDISGVIGAQVAMAHGTRIRANALHALGHYSSAVELHHEAVRLFAAEGQHEEVGRTLSACILSLNLCGQYEAAFSAADRARKIFTESGDELRLARLEINVGNVYYRQDRFADALACYRKAYEGVTKHQNREGVAAVLSNLSVCLIGLGEFQQALETYQHAREYCEQITTSPTSIFCAANTAGRSICFALRVCAAMRLPIVITTPCAISTSRKSIWN